MPSMGGSSRRTGAVVTATYIYDLNGNRTRGLSPSQTVAASYDAQDRLLSAGIATHVSNALTRLSSVIDASDGGRVRVQNR